MSPNTVRTIVGYWASLLRKHLRLGSRREALADIYNYLQISDTLSTSGQPTEGQLETIRREGFTTVINLAPHSAENALRDEARVVSALGMRYVHIPVDFKHPAQADFERFAGTLQAASNDKVWVHCAANMRVSAFVYRYRREVLRESAEIAGRDLHRIWEPMGAWKAFLADSTRSHGSAG